MTFCHSHKSVSCWTIIRDASFSSGWVLTQRYSTGQCTNIDFGTQSLKCYVFIKTLHSGFSELSGRGSRKITRAREDEQHQGNSVFPTPFVCTDACENSPRLWQHAQTPARRWHMCFHPWPSRYLPLTSTGKGKSTFLQWSLPRYINHIAGQTPGPEVVGQYRGNFMVLM